MTKLGTPFKSMRRMEEVAVNDNRDTMMYRAILRVTINECTAGPAGDPAEEAFTDVKLEDTELGYEYLYVEV